MRKIIFFSIFFLFLISCTQTSQEEFAVQGQLGDSKMDVAVFETNKGTIKVELDAEKAPITVANFKEYLNSGFYDGLVFHRVISGFMIQGGGFTTEGDQKENNDPIKLESQNGLSNDKGTIAMARTFVPDSATSQFFINLVDNDFLNYAPGNDGYAVFGKVTSGMEVVESIGAVETTTKHGMQDWPVEEVIVEKAYLE